MKLIYLTQFGTFCLSLFFLSCNTNKQEDSQVKQQQPAPFAVTTIPQKNVTTYTSYPTTLEGIVSSEVRAKVSGYIQKVYIDEGQKVTKEQTLFKLETQSLSQDAQAAQASVNAAQVEVNKLIPLVEKGIISGVQLETQKAKLAQAKSNYNSIMANIGYATVKSPVNGFAGAIPFREGTLISPNDMTPLTTVSNTSKMYAYFSMSESDYLDFLEQTTGNTLPEKIKNFPKVELELANNKTYALKGSIQTTTAQIDAKTGTVSFRAVFDNPNQLLTNGNSGTIKIPNTYQNVVVVPQSATFEQQGQVFVYKVNAENKAISQAISILDKNSYLYVVKDGLQVNDKIVCKGIGKLRNNTPITPNEIPFDSITKPNTVTFQ